MDVVKAQEVFIEIEAFILKSLEACRGDLKLNLSDKKYIAC